MVSGRLPPRKIAPRSGSGFGLGLALELGLGAFFLGGSNNSVFRDKTKIYLQQSIVKTPH